MKLGYLCKFSIDEADGQSGSASSAWKSTPLRSSRTWTRPPNRRMARRTHGRVGAARQDYLGDCQLRQPADWTSRP